MSLIAAFDLSLNSSGVCILDMSNGKPVHYESISSGLDGIERLSYNYNRYMNLFSTYRDLYCIAYEEQNTQMRYSYNAGSILKIAENVGVWELSVYHNLPYFMQGPLVLGVPAQDIKKYATGNGKATKEEMIAAVNGNHLKSIRRVIPEDSVNDVCDAYHLAKLARSCILLETNYSKYLVRDYRQSQSSNDNDGEVDSSEGRRETQVCE